MSYLYRKTNILPLLFVLVFFMQGNFATAQSADVSAPWESKLEELIKPSVDIRKMVPSLLAEPRQEVIDQLLGYAFRFKGRPYRSGSKGPSSFDCSGFTHYVFQKIALRLNASSSSQYLQGKSVDRENIQRGDLVFFKGANSRAARIGHVGLVSEVLPGGEIKFIHASCTKGICEESIDAAYYAKRFVGAKRVIEEQEDKN